MSIPSFQPRSIGSHTPLLQDFLERTAREHPDRIALVVAGNRFAYGELDSRANALARALRRNGVQRGDRVAIFGENTLETVLAFWATLKANAVASMVNPLTRAEKLAYRLNDCGVKVLFTEAHLAGVANEAARQSPGLTSTIVSGPWRPEQWVDSPGAISFPAFVEGITDPRCPDREAIDHDLATVMYTSGSTGDPKGVMLTHRNMVAAATATMAYLGLRADDVILCVLPLSFNYGLGQIIMAAALGATVVLERSFAFPAKVLKCMGEERVTSFPGVPTIFTTLGGIKDLSGFDLSSVRMVTNAAAALQERHLEAIERVFPRAQLFSMYGQTEATRISYLPPDELPRRRLSIGIAIPNTELWIIDEDGRRVGPNVPGQLIVRGPTVMAGYWEKPDLTNEKLRPGPVPGERVLYTGDCCRFDEDGFLYFVARMDDIIKTRGEKVSPVEVERAISKLPGVREVAVIGIPDEILGEAVKAVIACTPDAGLTIKAVQLHCQGQLESFMVPKVVEFVDELPKGVTGKIVKTALKEAALRSPSRG